MAHGLESRVPLLDHELVELAATMPADVKFKDGTMKHVFKRATRVARAGRDRQPQGQDGLPGAAARVVRRTGARVRHRRVLVARGARAASTSTTARCSPGSRRRTASAARPGACYPSNCGSGRSTTASTSSRTANDGKEPQVKVLITGGAGFIGSHLADRLLDEDHEVLVIDNYATGRRDNLTERDGLTIVEDTIEDAGAVDRGVRGLPARLRRPRRRRLQGPRGVGRGRADQRARHGQRGQGRAGDRRRAAALLPDRALLRHDADRAAGHARPPDPARLELRHLQDRGRAVHRAVGPRLRVVPARQRLRAAQHLRPAADLLPPADRGQGRVRDGHAARLHLRRRPGRRRDAGDRRRHGPRALPRLLRLGLLDQGAVRRHDRGAARGRARRATSRCARRARTTPTRSCSTRAASTRTSAGSRRCRSRRASAARSSTTGSTASPRPTRT